MTKRKRAIGVEEISGAWAIMPTPARDGADSWLATDTVDVDEAARVVDELIKSGIDGILSMGTLGECATLTWEEKLSFMGAIIDAAAGRVPIFVGTTSLNTRETVRETRAAHDMGATGTMLGLPMWCAPSLDVACNFFNDVAEACPEMGICVYDNKEAFKFEFPTAFWARVAAIPQVVTAKYSSMDRILPDIAASQERIRFLPVDAAFYGAARMYPEFCTAFWSSGAVCGPEVVIRFRDIIVQAKASGDWTKAAQMAGEIGQALSTLFPNGSFKEFSTYNIGLEKIRMNEAGWMKAGPIRPPYHIVPEAYAEGARKAGQLWSKLQAKYGLSD